MFALGLLAFWRPVNAIPIEFQYTLTDLGWFGGSVMIPTAINDAGQIVGYGATGTGDRHAFLYTGGSLLDLGTLGQSQSWAEDINNSGVIAGNAGTQSVNTRFTYANGTFTLLPSTLSEVRTIGNNGLVGGVTDYLGTYRAAVYDGTSVTMIEHVATSSAVSAINSSGQMIGSFTTSSSAVVPQAFFSSGGSFSSLGTLGGAGNWAYGLNDSGQVAGSSQTASNAWHAYVTSGGSLVDLGIAGTAWSINNLGQAVGEFGNNGGAFAYTGTGGVSWLEPVTDFGNTSFASLEAARAINNLGQIVGYGATLDGEQHAFLLTPTALTAVPEPETWGVIALSPLLALAARRILRRRSLHPNLTAAR